MERREYQTRAVLAVYQKVAREGVPSVLLVAPTGSGKTVMASRLIRVFVEDGARVLFLVPRRELALSAAKTISSFGPKVGLILPDKPRDEDAPVQIGTVQSLLRWPADELARFHVVFADEAHHFEDNEWRALVQRVEPQITIGLTATPERADGAPLGDMFDQMVVAADYSELLTQRHIVPCMVVRPEAPLEGGPELLAQDPLEAYQRWAPGTSAMVFVRRVAEGEALAARFSGAGIRCAAVHAETPPKQRDQAIDDLRTGRTLVLVNVYALTEGVDVPRVQTIVLARACQHVSTYLQIVGRALRPHHSKTHAMLIDLTGASYRHGMPTDDRSYSLSGVGVSSGEGLGGIDRDEPDERAQRSPAVVNADMIAVWPNGEPPELVAPPAPEEPTTHEPPPVVDLYEKAREAVSAAGECSVSRLRRDLDIGHTKATKFVERMEAEGFVGPGGYPRREAGRPRETAEDVRSRPIRKPPAKTASAAHVSLPKARSVEDARKRLRALQPPPAKQTLKAIVDDLYDEIVAAQERGNTLEQIAEAMGLDCSAETLANAKLRVKRERELAALRAGRDGTVERLN